MQTAEDLDLATSNLGPLAWVLDELRKSLESASSALRRFVRDAAQARGDDMTSVDTAQLRIARQHMHQSVGALEMVGLGAPALMLRSVETAVQKFVERPELCSEEGAQKVERAGFALTEYLEALLFGKAVSAVSLFPQYRDVQALAGADRVHPADLWLTDWRWTEPDSAGAGESFGYDTLVRSKVDQGVLRIVKTADPQAARDMVGVSLALAASQEARQPRVFWKICAGYFEAVALGLLPPDLYVKRAASRILMQYASLAKGDLGVSDRLAQDLVFFCAQAQPPAGQAAPALVAVRRAYGVTHHQQVDYTTSPFGRFDPVLLAQARKRIGQAKETWSALSGGDSQKLKTVAVQFGLVSDSLVKLHPPSAPLSQQMTTTIEAVVRAGRPPSAELAMEVATAILYLEAAFQDLDPNDTQLAVRTSRLADRLERVRIVGQPEPLESWMEELYRRVSDRQTMGSVVGELRGTLSELEKLLDIFFRNPKDKGPIAGAPTHLQQMRGVLSVLGMDQAAAAVQHMRESVEEIIDTEIDEERVRAAGTFDKLGNNLGALGFLIDMLNYQPALAKKLFVYDERRGELRPLMGRASGTVPREEATAPEVIPVLEPAAPPADIELSFDVPEPRAVAPAPPPVQPPAPAPLGVAPIDDSDEDDLRDIFLEEAREVVTNGRAAVAALASAPSDVGELTTLRRAFHTLKGSSRMVGLTEFGDAAWSLEQAINTWLGDQKPATTDLRVLADTALEGFGRWVEDIAQGQDGGWKAALFRGPADAMRDDQKLVPFVFADVPAVEADPVAAVFDIDFDAPAEVAAPEEITFDATQVIRAAVPPASELAPEELSEDFDLEFGTAWPADSAPIPELPPEIAGIDFGSLSAVSGELPAHEPEAAGAELPSLDAARDEQVKVIGDLRIAIPLYNVYLNEADEWSRRLVTEVGEWALELNHRIPDSTVGWAHALAGSSATVGFQTLSDIARALESALEHAQTIVHGTPQHAAAFTAAAEEIRRLLHQFAAGFLKEADPTIVHSLQQLSELDIPSLPSPMEQGESGFGDLDFAAALAQGEPQESLANEPEPVPVAPLAAPIELQAPLVLVHSREAPAMLASDDDFDLADVIDPDLFPIFEEEAVELMPNLGGALRQWAARPDNKSARDQCLRALHTLKGSARLAGALRLGEMAHRLESEIEHLGAEDVNPADVEDLLQRFDAMQARFDVLRSQRHTAEEKGAPVEVPSQLTDVLAEAAPATPPDDQPATRAKLVLTAPSALTIAPSRASSSHAVRVRSQLLDRLVNQAGEVMITRSRLEEEQRQLRSALDDLTGNLDRLRSQLREIELQAETQMQSRLAQAKDTAAGFDPLEFDRFTRVQELTRLMAESVNDVATVQRNIQRVVEATEDDLIAQARQTRELQRDLLRTRMVEFEGISDRLYRVVRQAAKEQGKQVKLDIVGGSIEMDRGVLDRMTPAFEHLLRNCVAHGIELPAQRASAGKAAAGSISIHLLQEANDVSVEFADDGAGLDLARIRETGLAQGLIMPGQQLSDAETANLIFLPGFSTATEVTALAGRGIGMDVVRSEVNALGGRIETKSALGRGSSFRLVLPLTTAVTQVVMVRTGSLSLGVPANLVEIVRRVSAKEVAQAYATGTYEFGGEQLPFFWSGALLQTSARSSEPVGKTLPVLVFKSAAQRVAVHIDEVLGNQEVVVKNLGPQLSRLPGLAGMTVLASGAVVLIYNPVALAQVYGEQAGALAAQRVPPQASLDEDAGAAGGGQGALLIPGPIAIPLVLVVDDSITVRRVTQRLLQREGYRVALAADGLQALERLAQERPTVVLSDIEMPRMDGFDLARNIRNDKALRELPIIMITSRIAEKHREHARELGVNHYLGKPYSEEELLSLVKHYCTVNAVAAV